MGGEREDVLNMGSKSKAGGVLEQAAPTIKPIKKQKGTAFQKLRFHESKGEVHFHDDDQKLKSAMPVADWFNAQARLNFVKSVRYVDRTNKTLLEIKPSYDETIGLLDINYRLTKIDIGEAFAKLSDFTRR